jgi:hypothetical protein
LSFSFHFYISLYLSHFDPKIYPFFNFYLFYYNLSPFVSIPLLYISLFMQIFPFTRMSISIFLWIRKYCIPLIFSDLIVKGALALPNMECGLTTVNWQDMKKRTRTI